MEAYVHDAVLDMHHGRDELERALAEIGADDWARKVPYGNRTLKELLAHLAGADQAWAVAAQGLLKGEAEHKAPLTPEEARAARARTIERGRNSSVEALLDEMRSRRRLLLTLYEELEQKHLTMTLPSYGDEHNSVRERIWLGYHDRLHAADIRRALAMNWAPPTLEFLPELREPVERLSPDETLYLIYSVDPTKWESPSIVPGWTNRNLLAHIASGDWVFQTHLRSLLDTGRASNWPNVDEGNAERLAERSMTTMAALVDEYLSMRHGTMLLLAQIEPKHLREKVEQKWKPPPHNETVFDYLRDFWWHERNHRNHLRPAMMYETHWR